MTIAQPAQREFTFTDADFGMLRRLVRELSGISLADCKREMIYSRLSRRLRHHGLDSFAGYRELLCSDDGRGELREFTNALTTNLTAFFREPHHFHYLRDHLLKVRLRDARASRRLRIWCAAASTGEEAWSVAMTIADTIPDWQRWDIRVLGTDLDTHVVEQADAAVYTPERLRRLDAALLERHFTREGEGASLRYRVRPELRPLVDFRDLNLMRPLPMRGPIDAIFCRNVIIYFDRDTQRELFRRLAPLQREGDLLFLGHSEGLFKVSEAWTLVGRTVYRRSGAC